jgi:hypothetical protein
LPDQIQTPRPGLKGGRTCASSRFSCEGAGGWWRRAAAEPNANKKPGERRYEERSAPGDVTGGNAPGGAVRERGGPMTELLRLPDRGQVKRPPITTRRSLPHQICVVKSDVDGSPELPKGQCIVGLLWQRGVLYHDVRSLSSSFLSPVFSLYKRETNYIHRTYAVSTFSLRQSATFDYGVPILARSAKIGTPIFTIYNKPQ